MAITQQRMISLIECANKLKSTVLHAQRFVQQTCATNPPNQALHLIQTYMAQLNMPLDMIDNLAHETAHFALHQRRNMRMAAQQRTKRGQSDQYNPARTTAPLTIKKQITHNFDQQTELGFAGLRAAATATANTALFDKVLPIDDEFEIVDGALTLKQTNIQQIPNTQQTTPTPIPASPSDLSIRKRAINAQHLAVNMPAPYTNPDNNDEPLLPDHSPQQLKAMGNAELF